MRCSSASPSSHHRRTAGAGRWALRSTSTTCCARPPGWSGAAGWARAADGAWTLDRAAEQDDLADWDRAFGGMATLVAKHVRLLVPTAEKERPELLRLAASSIWRWARWPPGCRSSSPRRVSPSVRSSPTTSRRGATPGRSARRSAAGGPTSISSTTRPTPGLSPLPWPNVLLQRAGLPVSSRRAGARRRPLALARLVRQVPIRTGCPSWPPLAPCPNPAGDPGPRGVGGRLGPPLGPGGRRRRRPPPGSHAEGEDGDAPRRRRWREC